MSSGCPNSTQRERWEAKVVKLEAQLEKLEASYDEAITGDWEEYKLDTAGGSQRVKRRSLSSIVKEMERIERELDQLYRRLNCQGVTSFMLRRRAGYRGGYGS